MKRIARMIYGANSMADIMAHHPEFVRSVRHLMALGYSEKETARILAK